MESFLNGKRSKSETGRGRGEEATIRFEIELDKPTEVKTNEITYTQLVRKEAKQVSTTDTSSHARDRNGEEAVRER